MITRKYLFYSLFLSIWVFFNYFTIERLFVFLQQIDMIERWISLDKESGSDLFRLMIRQLKEQVQIPEEFRK